MSDVRDIDIVKQSFGCLQPAHSVKHVSALFSDINFTFAI